MRITRQVYLAAILLVLPAALTSAQTIGDPVVETTTEGLTLAQTVTSLTRAAGSTPVGEALAFATALEIGTTPLPSTTASFVYTVDPATGLRVRQATTFGPSFAERALTSGEGKVAAFVTLISATYDRLGDFSLERMQLGTETAGSPAAARRGLSSLVIQSDTVVMSGVVGVTDKLDLSVSVPMVRVQVAGLSWVEDGTGSVLLRAEGQGSASGLGDIAMTGKYRLTSFGEGPPDPGGIALVGTVRLPTGERESFRGLGMTRALGSIVVSKGTGRFRPHGNAGFEFWENGIAVVTDVDRPSTVTARHQVQYAAGAELEATPKVTLLVDVLGRHILGAGRVGLRAGEPLPSSPEAARGVTSVESLVALDRGISKLTLAPGLRVNLKGNLLLSMSALVPLRDNGLHDRFTPVVGLDWTF